MRDSQLVFVRHGATALNAAGLRSGGDVDVPLLDVGRRQSIEAAERIRALGLRVGVIVASPLQRTRESADIIGRVLKLDVVLEPGFVERRLGAWNLQPVADTEAALAAGATPPGGESEREFERRIGAALDGLLPRLPQRPLLVGSKGVARMLAKLLGLTARAPVGNGELVRFDLSVFAERRAELTP